MFIYSFIHSFLMLSTCPPPHPRRGAEMMLHAPIYSCNKHEAHALGTADTEKQKERVWLSRSI